MDTRPSWDRVQELFNEAMELDPDGREAFLARMENSHPDLAAEMRSLLSAHREAGGFLSGSAAMDLSRTAAPGDRIGPYRIIEETGRGGMGVVFRAARDDENFRKEVAIKLIFPGMRSDEILKRFRAERQILAMLDHPFIARLIDGGTAPDGTPFLVMDFVTGKPLLKYCDEQRSDIDRRLEIFLSVCDAVQFAHQHLVIHRDLKPDNILVTENGTPRLLDFGIAKLVSLDTASAATVTAPMHRMMTPDYASPEQALGEPVTVAGDVYSLGVILYELLTGERPLRFETRTAAEILKVIAEQDPVPPSVAVRRSAGGDTAGLRHETRSQLRRRLSGDLDHIVLKALEKNPARRYGSVEMMAQDIRRNRDGFPVLARGQTTAYLLSRFVRRHRVAAVTGSIVLLSLVAGMIGTSWQAGVARRERDRATRRFNEVRELAHVVMFDIHDAIVDLPGSTKARETLVNHALKYLNGLSGDAGSDPLLQNEIGQAYSKIGDVQGRPMFSNLGQTAEALENYDRAMALLRSAAEARPESLSYSRSLVITTQRRADLLRTIGRPDEAMTQALSALSMIETLRSRYPEDPHLTGDLLLAHDRIGDWKLADADSQGAAVERNFCMNLAEEMFRKSPDDDAARRSIIIQCSKTADLMAARNDRNSAMISYRRAETMGREAVQSNVNNTEARRDLSVIYGLIGFFLVDGGAVDSGLAVYDQGMEISEKMAAQDPDNALFQADLAAGHFEIGTMLMTGNRYEPAESRFREAFDRFSRLAAADTSNVDLRFSIGRSGHHAGHACLALYTGAGSDAERLRWKDRARTWFRRSLDTYRGLERDGLLPADENDARAELTAELAELGN